jgi:hypothetical protein
MCSLTTTGSLLMCSLTTTGSLLMCSLTTTGSLLMCSLTTAVVSSTLTADQKVDEIKKQVPSKTSTLRENKYLPKQVP